MRLPLLVAVSGVLALLTYFNGAIAGSEVRDLELEGVFHGQGEGELDLQIVALDFDSHQFGVAVQTGGRDCSGDVRGVAKAIDSMTIVLAKKKEAGRSCRLTLKFRDRFQKVDVIGSDCSFFHGASCSFNGTLDRNKNGR